MSRSKTLAGLAVLVACQSVPITPALAGTYLSQYRGTPFSDSRQAGAQRIPGKVQVAYYDAGGEGVSYHDLDPQNHGSGELNPANGSYLHDFRIRDGGDTSYTKFNIKPDAIDDSAFNLASPPADQLYLGWTEPGEWVNITVQVAQAGAYTADLLYTSNRGGEIAIDVNGKPIGKAIPVTSTFDAADPIPWRQWHHWNLARNVATVNLTAGTNILTVHVVSGGNMNLAYLDFTKAP